MACAVQLQGNEHKIGETCGRFYFPPYAELNQVLVVVLTR